MILDALDFRSFCRSRKDSDTTAWRPKSWLHALARAACWPTYDSDPLRAALAKRECVPVIPSKASRSAKLRYDEDMYEARSEIECTFNLLKQARRFATRYEKTLRNYASVVALGCAMLWLRV